LVGLGSNKNSSGYVVEGAETRHEKVNITNWTKHYQQATVHFVNVPCKPTFRCVND